MGSKPKVKTPEYEKEAQRNAVKMYNIGTDLQSGLFGDYMQDLTKETGHREAGGASADIANVSAKQLKAVQTNPMAVAQHAAGLSADQMQGTLLAKNTAAVGDTSRRLAGVKSGVQTQARDMQMQANLANLANNAAVARAQNKQDKQNELVNSLAVMGAGAMDYAHEKEMTPYGKQLAAEKKAQLDRLDQMFGSRK
jgi:hypothetical protein